MTMMVERVEMVVRVDGSKGGDGSEGRDDTMGWTGSGDGYGDDNEELGGNDNERMNGERVYFTLPLVVRSDSGRTPPVRWTSTGLWSFVLDSAGCPVIVW